MPEYNINKKEIILYFLAHLEVDNMFFFFAKNLLFKKYSRGCILRYWTKYFSMELSKYFLFNANYVEREITSEIWK